MRYWGMVFWVLGFPAFADTTFLQAPLSFPQIETFLAARPDVKTVEAFLHEIPKENRDHYVLMHHSNSLQGSSYEQPRVLSITIDSNVALAFTGSNQQARGNTVEMWTFDRTKQSFEFREIVFENGHAKLSVANPPLCLGCHGQNPRPIWGSYPLWKGAYAEYRPNGGNEDSPEVQAKNRAFYDKQATTPRYQEMKAYTADEQSDRNVGFMHLVFEPNSYRVGKLMMATPFYDYYKYALLGAFTCLHSEDRWFRDFLPKALADQHKAAFKPEMVRDPNLGAIRLFSYLFEARGISTAGWATLIDPADTRVSSRFSDTDPADYEYQAPARLAYGWAKVDAEIGQLAKVDSPSGGGSVVTIDPAPYVYLAEPSTSECAELAARSQDHLGALLKQHTPAEIFRLSAQASQRTPRDVLESCANCHNGSSATTPKIPFGDIPALAKWLNDTPDGRQKIAWRLSEAATPKQQMPPGNPLPPGERDALLSFLQAL